MVTVLHFAFWQCTRRWQDHTHLPFAGGRIEGDVRINGHPKEQDSFARVSGYVEQFDTHSAAATVHEALMFSGVLRNENDIDHDTTEAFVDQVRVALLDHGTALLLYYVSCARSCLHPASCARTQCKLGKTRCKLGKTRCKLGKTRCKLAKTRCKLASENRLLRRQDMFAGKPP